MTDRIDKLFRKLFHERLVRMLRRAITERFKEVDAQREQRGRCI